MSTIDISLYYINRILSKSIQNSALNFAVGVYSIPNCWCISNCFKKLAAEYFNRDSSCIILSFFPLQISLTALQGSCATNPCHQLCTDAASGSGFVCSCLQGYKINHDTGFCEGKLHLGILSILSQDLRIFSYSKLRCEWFNLQFS